MQLTGAQIVEAGIITNMSMEGLQQQGIDLRLDRIGYLGGVGIVADKTHIPATIWMDKERFNVADSGKEPDYRTGYVLNPGYYEVELMEGCNIPNNVAMILKSRSSMVRCGAEVRSGQFDAGFHTEKMGCYLKVERTIMIEHGARICQAICNETSIVGEENLYKGQFQEDRQR